jgi:hypothetical protein
MVITDNNKRRETAHDLILTKPILAIFHFLFAECHLYSIPIIFIFPNEIFFVPAKIIEVLLTLLRRGSTQTLSVRNCSMLGRNLTEVILDIDESYNCAGSMRNRLMNKPYSI